MGFDWIAKKRKQKVDLLRRRKLKRKNGSSKDG